MRFSRIVLENWRNFGHVEVALQNRAFLVGPNASGKSNFLDVFRFLRDLVVPGGGFEQAVSSRGGIVRIRNLAARHPYTDVVIEVELEDKDVRWCYRVAFTQDGRRSSRSRPILTEEQVWRGQELVLDRPDEEDKNDAERLHQTYLEQTFANRVFREIADFFSSVQYFHLVPQLVREPERSIVHENDPYGSDFLEQIAQTSQRTQESRLASIQRVLQIAVPQLSKLVLKKDERGIPHLRGKYEHWRPAGAWQTEADFSDGTLRLMGLLWSLLDDKNGAPLLLEEPELSLHPAVVRRVPQMMLSVQRSRKKALRQTFISTHSADLLMDEGIAADEILLFIPTPEGSDVKVGVNIDEVRDLLAVGLPPGEVVIPYTQPKNVDQLSLWRD